MSLREQLDRARAASADDVTWQVECFRADVDLERRALETLLASGRVRSVNDTIADQVKELVETRAPRTPKAELASRVQAQLQGRSLDDYGTWVFFPWSGCLAHLLSEPEFRELRTSRNRYKITAEEQARLAAIRIGVVGLSVGHSTALTLALEGVGGELRLADFDHLSLSNLNRLRTGVHNLGVNKAVLTAREILELNPYARLSVFEEGITSGNIERFLTADGGLQLLIEECDDLYMKVFLRERARALRIPVLMETSDRGLIDVERFDREPDRPLLHGLIGEVRAETLAGLATADKVPFVLDILGLETLSPRFTGSLVEIDRTLKTWPQLASAVALGGAVNTDTARRIALGQFEDSGRYYVDLERVVRGATPIHTPPPPAEPAPKPALPAPAGDGWRERLMAVAHAATLAPSGGNAQPWRLEGRGRELQCFLDPRRAATFLDFRGTASQLACGAAAENAVLEAGVRGLCSRLELGGASKGGEQPVWTLHLEEGAPEVDPLAAFVTERVTNRRWGERRAIGEGILERLRSAAAERGASVSFALSDDALSEVGAILGSTDRLRILHGRMHEDMMNEVRWTSEQAARSGDGLDLRSLELSGTDEAGIRLASSWPAMKLLAELGLGSALEELAHKALHASSAAALIWTGEDSATAHLTGGRAVERVWLAAQACGLAVQPWSALPYLLARDAAGGEGFEEHERQQLESLERRLRAVLPSPPGATRLLLVRLAWAPPPSARSLRRPLTDVMRLLD